LELEFGAVCDAARLSGKLPRGTEFLFSSGAIGGRLSEACDRGELPLGFAFPTSLSAILCNDIHFSYFSVTAIYIQCTLLA
jgi:hypothetical protein